MIKAESKDQTKIHIIVIRCSLLMSYGGRRLVRNGWILKDLRVLVYGCQLGVRGVDGGGRTEACVVGAATAAEAD
ncbi:hypothetical protein GOBAR_DD32450 [Gossypium barbadense]|nr:hypothetical protein GOBAR_DD32450 [Gossypium barbadense]